MGGKCQVCDGPVVSGRCKLCGMPYRKDEILYHPNERRSEHYKHATDAARKQMRVNQIPLQDRKKAVNTPAKQTKKHSWASVVVMVIILVSSIVPKIVDYVKTEYEEQFITRYTNSEPVPVRDISEKIYSPEWIETEGMELQAILNWDNGFWDVGVSKDGRYVELGLYVMENTGEQAKVIVWRWTSGEEEEYEFSGGEEQAVLELHEKDLLYLDDVSSKKCGLLLYLIEQYDE